MDLGTVRARRRRTLFRPWNSYLAKKGAVEAAPLARHLDLIRARAHAGLASHPASLVRLTVKLIDTYEGINDTYYRSRAVEHVPSSPMPSSDQEPLISDYHLQTSQQQQHHHHHHHHLSYPHDSSSVQSYTATSANDNTNANYENTINNNNNSNSSTRVPSPHSVQYCDENFDYIVRTGDVFNNRYMLEKVIGRGSFGQVVRALDNRDNTHVAIKIIKNNSLYVEQALSEVRMTSYLNSIDPEDEHSIMRLRDKFIFRGHQCLVLELLSFSLYDLLRSTEFYGVSLNLVRKFCKQILNCLAFLARSDINIAHCDLKPENVLLRHPQRSAIKVVDFGASCRISESMFVYVQSRFYRAPEVILGLPYGTQVDVWSLGCMLIELHTGYPVFAGKDEGDQIAIIVERLGIPPSHMLERGKRSHMFFEQDVTTGAWRLRPSVSEEHGCSLPGSKPIRAFVDFHTGATNGRRKRISGGHSEEDYEVFLALAAKMLRYDPEERITADGALSDAFVLGVQTARSGRESPPPMPTDLGAVGDHVHVHLDPGRKAPLQRRWQQADVEKVSVVERDSQKGVDSTANSDVGDDVPRSFGGALRQSKSESALEPVAERTFVFPRSDWAEEVGIDPPPWRSGPSSLIAFGDSDNPATFDPRCSLGGAGGGVRIVRRRLPPSNRPAGGGTGLLCSNSGPTGRAVNMQSIRHTCTIDRERRESFTFGLGGGPVGADARASAIEDMLRSTSAHAFNPALPRGHGNTLLLFTG